MRALRTAFGFLTILPVHRPADVRPTDLGRAAVYFPLVGLTLGLLLASMALFAGRLFPPLLVAALVLIFWAALTGGLHLEGLTDCGDGLLVSAPPERRLEILHDVRVGAFGATWLVLFLLLKLAAIAAQPNPWGLLLAPILGRWALLVGGAMPAARRDGLGSSFRERLDRRGFALAALQTALVCGLYGWRGLAAFLAANLTLMGLVFFARRRIGGVTGDVIGAGGELAEAAALLALAAAGWP